MQSKSRSRWGLMTAALFATVATFSGAGATELPPQAKQDAPIVVDGIVREVFQSSRQSNTDYIVQIEVQASVLGKAPQERLRMGVPTPGDDVYVHVFQRRSDAPQGPSAGGHRSLPAEGTTVRAYLFPRAQGGWTGAYPDWFDVNNNIRMAAEEIDPAAREVAAAPVPSAPAQGMSVEGLPKFFALLGIEGALVNAGVKLALQATDVVANSPAALAGIEPKDVILEVNGAPLSDLAKLAESLQKGGPVLKLGVLDSRTGKILPVDLNLARASAPPAGRPPLENIPSLPPLGGAVAEAGPRDLGIDAEPVALGLRQALRVTAVTPGSLAQKAGIQAGDVIVDADGLPVSSPTSLMRALNEAEGTLTLTIRDVNTGKNTPVQIPIGGAPAASPAAAPAQAKVSGIGLAADPIFVGGRVALKVTEVQPGSPAQKAGFEPGDIIAAVNDRPVDSVDQIIAVAKKSGPKLKVTVLDIRTRKPSVVDFDLNAR